MKIYLKFFICGLIAGISSMGLAAFGSGGIRYAAFNSAKVSYNGKELDLSGQQLISLLKEGERYPANYVPVRALLEELGYDVKWDQQRLAIDITKYTSILEEKKEYYKNDFTSLLGDNTSASSGKTNKAASVQASRNLTRKIIDVPNGLTEIERSSFLLISKTMGEEMDEIIGPVMTAAKESVYADLTESMTISKTVGKELNDIILRGSKTVLGIVYKPDNENSSDYTKMYSDFCLYAAELDKMLMDLKNGNFTGALSYYENARRIYLTLLAGGA